MVPQKYTDKQIADALHKSKGVISQASLFLGCNYDTVWKRVQNNKDMNAIVQQYKNSGESEQAIVRKIPKQSFFYSEEQMIDALEKANGKISVAAKKLGCTVQTIYAYLRTKPNISNRLNEIREELNDIAEDRLFELVKSGDLQAIKYYLDANAKNRGYGADKNINVRQIGFNVNANVDLSSLSLEELEVLNELIGKTESRDGSKPSSDSIIDAEFTDKITD